MPLPFVPLIIAGAMAAMAYKGCSPETTSNAERAAADQEIFDKALSLADHVVDVTENAGEAAAHLKPSQDQVPIAAMDGSGRVRVFVFTKSNASVVEDFARKYGRVARYIGPGLTALDLANQAASPEFYSGIRSIVTSQSNFQQSEALRQLESEEAERFRPTTRRP